MHASSASHSALQSKSRIEMTKAGTNDDDGEQNEVAIVVSRTPSLLGASMSIKNQSTVTEAEKGTSSSNLLQRELELVPVTMYPQQVSRATEIRLFLSRIEFVAIHDVVERDGGVVYFVLDVYRYHQQKGLPSACRKVSLGGLSTPHKCPTKCEPKYRSPDYQIEQRYSSFARLRSNVAHIARKHHPRYKSCAYCTGLLNFLRVTPYKPSLKVKFTTTAEERKHILSSFINELVYVVRGDYTSCRRSLRGYHIIPALVKRFLSEQTGELIFS